MPALLGRKTHQCSKCHRSGHNAATCGKVKTKPKYDKVYVRKTDRPTSGKGMSLAQFTSSDGHTIYNVRRGKDGVIYCECLGWRMTKKRNGERKAGGRTCKHIKQYLSNDIEG